MRCVKRSTYDYNVILTFCTVSICTLNSVLKVLSFKLLCTVLFSRVYSVVLALLYVASTAGPQLSELNSMIEFCIRVFCQYCLLCGSLVSLEGMESCPCWQTYVHM